MIMRLAGVAIAALPIAACISNGHVLTRAERATAEIGARAYGEKNGTSFISCFGKDINGDGSVTCTVRAGFDGEVQDLLCSYQDQSPGCKRKPKA